MNQFTVEEATHDYVSGTMVYDDGTSQYVTMSKNQYNALKIKEQIVMGMITDHPITEKQLLTWLEELEFLSYCRGADSVELGV